jgi:PEP-CTERM motif
MKVVVPVLAAAFIATVGAGSAAQAGVIDFAVSVVDGMESFSGPTLNASTAFNFDGSTLIVSSLGNGDQSGLENFKTGITVNDVVTLSPTDVMYGAGTGSAPLATDVVKSWTGIVDGAQDVFTETLTNVASINRATANAITVVLTGTVSDADGTFKSVPIDFIFNANQAGGPGHSIGASFTNTTTVPEPSTWVMMALGFVGLGYAAVRRSAKDKAAFAI